jgi:hypothetical protein
MQAAVFALHKGPEVARPGRRGGRQPWRRELLNDRRGTGAGNSSTCDRVGLPDVGWSATPTTSPCGDAAEEGLQECTLPLKRRRIHSRRGAGAGVTLHSQAQPLRAFSEAARALRSKRSAARRNEISVFQSDLPIISCSSSLLSSYLLSSISCNNLIHYKAA